MRCFKTVSQWAQMPLMEFENFVVSYRELNGSKRGFILIKKNELKIPKKKKNLGARKIFCKTSRTRAKFKKKMGKIFKVHKIFRKIHRARLINFNEFFLRILFSIFVHLEFFQNFFRAQKFLLDFFLDVFQVQKFV